MFLFFLRYFKYRIWTFFFIFKLFFKSCKISNVLIMPQKHEILKIWYKWYFSLFFVTWVVELIFSNKANMTKAIISKKNWTRHNLPFIWIIFINLNFELMYVQISLELIKQVGFIFFLTFNFNQEIYNLEALLIQVNFDFLGLWKSTTIKLIILRFLKIFNTWGVPLTLLCFRYNIEINFL